MAKALKNRLIYGIHDSALQERAARLFHGRLVDIGCGTKPYEPLLSPYVTEHVGVDHEGGPHDHSNVDLPGTAYSIPAEDAAFDCALCTAVLEHLEEPEVALRECLRVLKPGGVAIYTVPFIWHLHEEPRDFYRFSKYGLQYLFRKVGFEVVEVQALSGFWVTFCQLLVYNLDRQNNGLLKSLRVVDTVGLIIQWLGGVLDRIDRAEAWTWMYLVVARRPSQPGPRGPRVDAPQG